MRAAFTAVTSRTPVRTAARRSTEVEARIPATTATTAPGRPIRASHRTGRTMSTAAWMPALMTPTTAAMSSSGTTPSAHRGSVCHGRTAARTRAAKPIPMATSSASGSTSSRRSTVRLTTSTVNTSAKGSCRPRTAKGRVAVSSAALE